MLHIQRDWKKAVEDVSAGGRLIQRSFFRAFRRNAEGDIDESLIPQGIHAWYESEDEETVEEVTSKKTELTFC